MKVQAQIMLAFFPATRENVCQQLDGCFPYPNAGSVKQSWVYSKSSIKYINHFFFQHYFGLIPQWAFSFSAIVSSCMCQLCHRTGQRCTKCVLAYLVAWCFIIISLIVRQEVLWEETFFLQGKPSTICRFLPHLPAPDWTVSQHELDPGTLECKLGYFLSVLWGYWPTSDSFTNLLILFI